MDFEELVKDVLTPAQIAKIKTVALKEVQKIA
jgi:hypothetical protein